MNSEIKRLEMRIKFGGGDEELDLIQSAALRDLMNAYESQITTLTAERDAARKELAVLKAAPGMEEVDALGKSATQTLAQIVLDRPETNRPAIDTVPAGRYAKLRDLIDAMLATCRRSIAARDEVVGLLKWVFRNQDLQSDRAILSDEARRILEIVEGEVNGH